MEPKSTALPEFSIADPIALFIEAIEGSLGDIKGGACRRPISLFQIRSHRATLGTVRTTFKSAKARQIKTRHNRNKYGGFVFVKSGSGSNIREHYNLEGHGKEISGPPSQATSECACEAVAGFPGHPKAHNQDDSPDGERLQHKHGWMHHNLRIRITVGQRYASARAMSICRTAYICIYYPMENGAIFSSRARTLLSRRIMWLRRNATG